MSGDLGKLDRAVIDLRQEVGFVGREKSERERMWTLGAQQGARRVLKLVKAEIDLNDRITATRHWQIVQETFAEWLKP